MDLTNTSKTHRLLFTVKEVNNRSTIRKKVLVFEDYYSRKGSLTTFEYEWIIGVLYKGDEYI